MQSAKIETYFAQRQAQAPLPVRLYALVDALLYGRGEPVERPTATIGLFDGTPDASLADAGPWLIDFEEAPGSVKQSLFAMGAGADGVSWLISAYPFPELAHELAGRLNARMPDGRTALLRFYDARLMAEIARLLSFTQRIEFFVPTFDWFVEINGELTRVHPHA
ncbi:hypothetical protein LMG22037_02032 [Paraburkholderia phenoliruptrix]|uniref:DUF4123 domain-containing protein n=1 Tax=Paraburkholderia phenoliruptrix TaxID=252970 RepID=A0A6J5ATD3_9BURK|nr:DUF4123 domain-containing protein [Paraburkholderia phenoliruptrix]CAB3672755.1 hypothetical protein LMG22037_02032 [Paraburkholderia phenoliruptrix]